MSSAGWYSSKVNLLSSMGFVNHAHEHTNQKLSSLNPPARNAWVYDQYLFLTGCNVVYCGCTFDSKLVNIFTLKWFPRTLKSEWATQAIVKSPRHFTQPWCARICDGHSTRQIVLLWHNNACWWCVLLHKLSFLCWETMSVVKAFATNIPS